MCVRHGGSTRKSRDNAIVVGRERNVKNLNKFRGDKEHGSVGSWLTEHTETVSRRANTSRIWSVRSAICHVGELVSTKFNISSFHILRLGAYDS